MEEELKAAARDYSRLVDAWNATAGLPPSEGWRSSMAFSLQEQALKRLGQAARRFAKT